MALTMRAAVLYAANTPLKIEEVELHGPNQDELLVRLAACGVCHSDLSVLNELFPCPTPVVLGHEASGVVEEVGRSVTRMHVGDHVVASWSPACGQCRYCREGWRNLCVDLAPMGFTYPGGMSEDTVIVTPRLDAEGQLRRKGT